MSSSVATTALVGTGLALGVGEAVGAALGDAVGTLLGAAVGVGLALSATLGVPVGAVVGTAGGVLGGVAVAADVGAVVGALVAAGLPDGTMLPCGAGDRAGGVLLLGSGVSTTAAMAVLLGCAVAVGSANVFSRITTAAINIASSGKHATPNKRRKRCSVRFCDPRNSSRAINYSGPQQLDR